MTRDKLGPGEERVRIIDWGEVRGRVERAGAALTQGAAASPEESRALLRARAKALARRRAEAGGEGGRLDVVAFRLAAETYGLEAGFVREVQPLKDFTPLPGVPEFVLGLVNVRGEILSVVDLRKFFNLPERGLGELNKIIILSHEGLAFGVLADAVLGALSLPLAALLPPPPTVTGIGAEYLKGVTAERAVILDALRILGDGRLIVHQGADTNPRSTNADW